VLKGNQKRALEDRIDETGAGKVGSPEEQSQLPGCCLDGPEECCLTDLKTDWRQTQTPDPNPNCQTQPWQIQDKHRQCLAKPCNTTLEEKKQNLSQRFLQQSGVLSCRRQLRAGELKKSNKDSTK
jgi:hypothetical protein